MGGGGQECPSGASAQQAADVGAVGAESQRATVQQHEPPSNAESYDLTVSGHLVEVGLSGAWVVAEYAWWVCCVVEYA